MTLPAQPPGFSELIHAPTRLSLMSLCSATRWIEFGRLRESLQLTDSALSKQITTLEQAGFVVVHRNGVGRGKRMHVRLSPEGRAAFEAHVEALRAIVDRAPAEDPAGPPDPPDAPPGDTVRTGGAGRAH
ncbi:winged helix-turn-helix domain-containing protein [Pseudonocardia sp. HH130630-07]|uniref:winged helix-turn-helix domain-containing protein n=1 Tax=Pseudonocardia sp. HH130630-07 TaxID=1690815 RepID=UPI000839D42E|nr:transcriptional regulator [Pseudonocardia sp. HH130630-07]